MSPERKRIVYPFIALAAAVVIIGMLMAFKKEPERKPEVKAIPSVEVTPIEVGPMELTVESQGLVKAKYETDLISQVSGQVSAVSPAFVRGGLVKKGELLVQVDPFDYEVRVEQAKANLASARATFILERAQGQVAEAEWEKISTAKPSDLGLRKPQQEQALAGVKAAEAGLKQAIKDLERTSIVAPADVLIGDRSVSVGTFVNVGTRVGQVMDVSKAEVRLPVAGSDLRFLVDGGEGAKVILESSIDGITQRWPAQISRDEGVVNENSRMMFLVAEFNDPYQLNGETELARLPFGTFVTAKISGLELEHAAVVPRHLVKNNRIAIFEDNKLNLKEITIVRHQGKQTVISDGLIANDQLITSAMQHTVDGMDLKLFGSDEDVSEEDGAEEEIAAPNSDDADKEA